MNSLCPIKVYPRENMRCIIFSQPKDGWLPFQTGDRIMDTYNPNSCAHQFGYDQVVPAPALYRELLSCDMMTLSMSWSSFFRLLGWDFQAHIHHWTSWMLKRISSILHPCGGFRLNLLLGWLWLHEVGALASSLHKKAQAFFLLGKTVVTIATRTGL